MNTPYSCRKVGVSLAGIMYDEFEGSYARMGENPGPAIASEMVKEASTLILKIGDAICCIKQGIWEIKIKGEDGELYPLLGELHNVVSALERREKMLENMYRSLQGSIK